MDEQVLMTVTLTLLTTLIASSGFWAFVDRRRSIRRCSDRLLVGLAHNDIVHLCMSYIHRGCISHDELENIITYLYEPYKEMGGNGAVEKLVEDVKRLRVCNRHERFDTYGRGRSHVHNQTLSQGE